MASYGPAHLGTYLIVDAVIEACHKTYSKAVESITRNGNLSTKDFKEKPLYLSEAYCLLWHNAGTGDVDGRKSSMYLKTGALAAVMVDLYALGKIDFISDMERLEKGKANHLMVEVIDPTPTGTYLDEAAFDKILALKKTRQEKPSRSLMEWFNECSTSCSVSTTLNNLIARGILGKEQAGLFGTFTKYPLLDKTEEQSLADSMRQVALKGLTPDSYMLSLLTLTRTADDSYTFSDPILEKYFPSNDYKAAKEKIKAIVQNKE